MKESSFRLIGKPQITMVQFEINKEYTFEKEIALEINNNIRVIKNKDKQKNDSIVILKVYIFASEEIKDVPFRMSIEIQGCFIWDESLAKDTLQLDALLRQNAPAVLYSYLRPIITLITVEANMPPLVLPLMNFVEIE